MGRIIVIAVILIVVGTTAFHLIHHIVYCQYRKVPGKSHCAQCGHRKICQKYHFKKERR